MADTPETRQAQFFDTVSLAYRACAPGGEVIAEAPESAPVTVSIGSGALSLAVEAALMGMSPGESRTLEIQPEDAFGPYDPRLRQDIPREVFGERLDPRPGMILALNVDRDGARRQVPATVLAADQRTVTVDYNHPLAGKVITWEVRLLAIGS